jgi:hypothetical protein
MSNDAEPGEVSPSRGYPAWQRIAPRPWRRLYLSHLIADVPQDAVEDARAVAAGAQDAVYPGLPFTETNFEWVLLYEHIGRGQIRPEVLRLMRRADLQYLAGHPAPHPDLIDPPPGADRAAARGRAMKIVENIARASRELDRRDALRNVWISTAVAATFGGAAGYLLASVLGAN